MVSILKIRVRELKRDITLLIIFGLIFLGIVVLAVSFLPSTSAWVVQFFDPGLGLKTASIIGFFVTIILFVVFAIAAGDGLFGEIQFMIGGFMAFWLIFTLMIAWVF